MIKKLSNLTVAICLIWSTLKRELRSRSEILVSSVTNLFTCEIKQFVLKSTNKTQEPLLSEHGIVEGIILGSKPSNNGTEGQLYSKSILDSIFLVSISLYKLKYLIA